MKKKLFWSIALLGISVCMSVSILVSTKDDSKSSLTFNLSEITAGAQSGTCCPEYGSWCIIGQIEMWSYYYKSSGACG